GSANSFFIIPGVRVVFALRLLLPGGGAGYPPAKTEGPALRRPARPTPPAIILRSAFSKQKLINKKKTNPQLFIC
ncbi:hypothetical protein ACVGXT_00135, partial [Enterobacter intestinihominis]